MMTESRVYRSELSLPNYPQNLAEMLNRNSEKFVEHPIYQEIQNNEYVPLMWQKFQHDVISMQHTLRSWGFQMGDRMAILSQNRQEMLELELAVMAMGAVAVPIFAGYPSSWANAYVEFCEPKFVAVADETQYKKLSSPKSFERVIHFDPISQTEKNTILFSELLSETGSSSYISGEDVTPSTICLMMYTSGTMGRPKSVQLTHRNILSQQAAMRILWKLSHRDRFLSYLPWHHSFGGIFEKYAAINNGAVLSLENGYGKNIKTLLDNWKKVFPTAFFSVPRIYQNIATQILQDEAIEQVIFHDELRFIFTAAAPLPKNISNMFEDRGIPVYEGWGLTETSPCCTVTDPKVPREPGVVGKPIPGVSLRLAEDGEIMVKGFNVMTGYFKNREETEKVLTRDGWFYTGDVGEFVETGLRLISRKDRIFKLSNAEKVIPTEIENLIAKDCVYLAHGYVAGSGKAYTVILLFPNRAMFSQKSDNFQPMEGCKCPENPEEYSRCLVNCLKNWNDSIELKYSRLKKAMLVDYELSIENEELTPSMKLAPNVIGKVFKANIEFLYGEEEQPPHKVYVINLE